MTVTVVSVLTFERLRHLERVSTCFSGREKTAEQLALLDLRDATLPVRQNGEMAKLLRFLSQHRHFTIGGRPGSGKSTQITQLVSRLTPKCTVMIVVSGRIAARLLHQRLRFEMGVEDDRLYWIVGLRMRVKSAKPRREARIVVVTEGMALRETMHDVTLQRYGAILFDEVQELSGNMEVLIAFSKWAMQNNPHIRFGYLSGTSDFSSLRNYLSLSPESHYTLPALNFPVEIRYASEHVTNLGAWIIEKLSDFITTSTGDVIIFAAGLGECDDFAKRIKHAGLSEEMDIFVVSSGVGDIEKNEATCVRPPGSLRRVIVGTNVLENTITIPGVVLVLDTLVFKLGSHDPHLDHRRLIPVLVSVAQAEQRAGRCGRTQAGRVERAITKGAWDLLVQERPYSKPKVMVEEYTGTLLTNLALTWAVKAKYPHQSLGNVLEMLNTPSPARQSQAISTLKQLDAITTDDSSSMESVVITSTGCFMNRLSASPEYARSLIAADKLGCLAEMILLVAANSTTTSILLKTKDIKNPTFEHNQNSFVCNHSDHITNFNALRAWYLNDSLAGFATVHGLRLAALRELNEVVDALSAQMDWVGSFMDVIHSQQPEVDLMLQSLVYGHLHKIAVLSSVPGAYTRYSNGQKDLSIDDHSPLRAAKHPTVLFSDPRRSDKSHNATIIDKVSRVKLEWVEQAAADISS